MSESTAGNLLEAVCYFKARISMLFVLCVVLFGMMVVSYLVVEPGTASYVITVVNLVTLGSFLVATGGVLFYCRGEE